GRVIGFGATVPEANRQTRADTTRLFQSIIDLTDGQRTTSTAVSYPVLNTVQMDGVRDTLYQQLAQDARTFLVSGHAPGRLYIAAAWPAPAIYRMNIQLRQGRSRSQMRTEVESRAAKTHHASATVYLDEANSRWSYIVITSSPRQSITIELPESGAMPLVREQIKREQELREQMAREQAVRESIQREEARRSTIYATD
ncbi:MAG: hypothetical protein JOZ57_17825, partial [Abitibacteriaceae bacterium]|nr:hypothetical protein [Abditibacteriaceae bacterium]